MLRWQRSPRAPTSSSWACPFSDPVADGPVIQRASERALQHGTDLAGVLDVARQIRSSRNAGLIIFSYLNPILQFGLEQFCAAAADAGVDGALVTDLPVEEAGDYLKTMKAHKLAPIFLAAPTSTDDRLRADRQAFARICLRHLAHRHHRRAAGIGRRRAFAGRAAASLHQAARSLSALVSPRRSSSPKSAASPTRRSWAARSFSALNRIAVARRRLWQNSCLPFQRGAACGAAGTAGEEHTKYWTVADLIHHGRTENTDES